ncbi:hypothetical protein PR202_ga20971 [Eleusine coracana subsp. coracana]|uniref:CCHC-type domain-containing protein n=1 Tax=Eleusine coracana subsp. coracana TaxID=191504 RepID=A0AAV5CZL8_ELECO|nr:hypothetical protein QOZ80_8AG0630870 [Eleusine coracana subsp. coracana]GJN03516.1 hypothetical protein PR202_ga20971 [Eleusine coracana subsp. coracana]
MASLPIKPLDGGDGYHRWKESVLLRLRSVDVAHVLFDDPPAPAAADPAALKKWARDDEVCRGHILAALSDRLFHDYSRHATSRALWQAVARTYDLDTMGYLWRLRLDEFRFDRDAPLLDQIAQVEALAVAADFGNDEFLAYILSRKLQEDIGVSVTFEKDKGGICTERVWEVAREQVRRGMQQELETKVTMKEYQEGRVCWSCDKPGHSARNCRAA